MSDYRQLSDDELSDQLTELLNNLRRMYLGRELTGCTYSEQQLLDEYKRRHARPKVRERVRGK